MSSFIVAAVVLTMGMHVPASQVEPAGAKPVFVDVPETHWAAPAVNQLALSGVLKGFPDATFKGEQPVTRYELAVALARFVELVEAGRKPVVSEASDQPELRVSLAKSPLWAKGPIETLVRGGFVPEDSSILSNGDKPVTQDELAQALASIAVRIIENQTVEPDSKEIH